MLLTKVSPYTISFLTLNVSLKLYTCPYLITKNGLLVPYLRIMTYF